MNTYRDNSFAADAFVHRSAVTAIAALCLISFPAQAALSPPPADYANAALELTRTYRGADSSAFSTRAIGNTVVGFSELAGGQRAFVFKGTRSGLTITGQYWDVAKGASSTSGPLVLTISNGGSNLHRSGGGDVGTESWEAKLPSQIYWPPEREAFFQSIDFDDLDGAFKTTDGTRAYVGQYGSEVVYFTERFAPQGGTRPIYASVVVAQRGPDDSLTGTFYDLPKQTTALKSGTLLGQAFTQPRRFAQIMYDSQTVLPIRSWLFNADYAIDLDVFAQEIEDRLTPFTVGFGYGIAQDGVVVRKGAGGSRRAVTASNGLLAPLPFTWWTLNETASTTKTVTLVAVLRALREQGISVDSPVSPYLPAQWPRGIGMNTVTFRQLLSHGKKPVESSGMFKPGNCGTDFYGCLAGAVAVGMTEEAGYDNIHYTIFRLILPFIIEPEAMADLFANETDETVINEVFSSVFRDEIRSVLAIAGVTADFEYEPGMPAAYRYAWGTPPTNEIAPTGSETDYLEAGSGGLKMNAAEFAQFLSRLENGSILTPADLATAKAIGFGGTGPMNGPADVGPLWTKNGGAGGAASQLMILPGTEVFITRNSTGNAAQSPDSQMLRDAWQASLIGPGN